MEKTMTNKPEAVCPKCAAAWKQAKEIGEAIGLVPLTETSLDGMVCAIGDKYSEITDKYISEIRDLKKRLETAQKDMERLDHLQKMLEKGEDFEAFKNGAQIFRLTIRQRIDWYVARSADPTAGKE